MSQDENKNSLLRRQADLNRMVIEHFQSQQRKRLEVAMAFWRDFFKEQEQEQNKTK